MLSNIKVQILNFIIVIILLGRAQYSLGSPGKVIIRQRLFKCTELFYIPAVFLPNIIIYDKTKSFVI